MPRRCCFLCVTVVQYHDSHTAAAWREPHHIPREVQYHDSHTAAAWREPHHIPRAVSGAMWAKTHRAKYILLQEHRQRRLTAHSLHIQRE